MEYIVLDLEWNNGYSRKLKRSINEIIEIGALRITDDLKIADSFKQMVKTQLTGRLSDRVKALTNIDDSEVAESGVSFTLAVERLKKWAGDKGKTYITWSDTDMYVLNESNINLDANVSLDFIENYMDVQKYCQNVSNVLHSKNQISLINAATMLGIKGDEDTLHRANADCSLAAECFIHCYDSKKIKSFIHKCDSEFFERLMFKSYPITDLSLVDVDLDSYNFACTGCSKKLVRLATWKCVNNSFRTVFICQHCKSKYDVTVRIKQKYKTLDVKCKVAPVIRREKIDVVTEKSI